MAWDSEDGNGKANWDEGTKKEGRKRKGREGGRRGGKKIMRKKRERVGGKEGRRKDCWFFLKLIHFDTMFKSLRSAVPNLCGLVAWWGGRGTGLHEWRAGVHMHACMHSSIHTSSRLMCTDMRSCASSWTASWTACTSTCALVRCLHELSCAHMCTQTCLSHGPVPNSPWPGSEPWVGGWRPLP